MTENISRNYDDEDFIVSPPGIKILKDEKIVKRFLICEGKGRIERYARIAIGEKNDFKLTTDYNVLPKDDTIVGNRELIGYATSVASSQRLGTTTAIAVIAESRITENHKTLPERVLYQNLHWKHWRVALLKPLSSSEKFF